MTGANQSNENRHIRDQEATTGQEQGEAFACTIACHLSARDIDEAATLEAYRSAWEAMRPADSLVSELDKFITKDIVTRLDQVVASRARKCITSDSTWRKIQTCLKNPPWNLLKIHIYAIFGEYCWARTFLPVVRQLSMLKRADDGRSLSLDEAFPVFSRKRDERRSGLARVQGVEQEPQWQAWEFQQTIGHFVQEGWVERMKAPVQGRWKKKKEQDQRGPSDHERNSSGCTESLRQHEAVPINTGESGLDRKAEAEQADADTETDDSVRSGDDVSAVEHDVNPGCPPERSTTTTGIESEVWETSQADIEETNTATTDGADEDDFDNVRAIEQGRRVSERLSFSTAADFSFESTNLWETTLGSEGGGMNTVSAGFRASASYAGLGNNDQLDATPRLILSSSPAQRDTTPRSRYTRAIEQDSATAFASAAASPVVLSTATQTVAATTTPMVCSKSRFVNQPLTTTSTMADDDASASRKRPRTSEPIRSPPLERDLRASMQARLTPALRDELLTGLRACFDIFSVASPSRSQTAEPTLEDDVDDPLAPCRLDAPDGSSYIAFLCGMCLVHIPPASDRAKDHPEATVYVPMMNPRAERDNILTIFSKTTEITRLDQEHVRIEELGSETETDQQIFLVAAKVLRAAYPNGNAAQAQIQQDVVASVWRRFLRLCIQRNSVASRLSSESFMQAFDTLPTVDLASIIPVGECADPPFAAQAATAEIATLQTMEKFPEEIEKLIAGSEEIRKLVIARLGHVDKEAAPPPSDTQQIQQIENLLNSIQDDESLRTKLEDRLEKLHSTARASHDKRKTTLQRLKSSLAADKTEYMDARDAHAVKMQIMKEGVVKAWREALLRVETACGVGQAGS
ncbi:hypothetical protein HII31_05575 [Pseudocercospora fuligena]|uniref:Uncharacterized protein n=1 Tax=Pseudocercospora fuligena TaxID=685502 RepID=A0A8H6RLK5_9PEZI|nr:hypothetical protein HII31_05575 [Pseudocercospora fuligena]